LEYQKLPLEVTFSRAPVAQRTEQEASSPADALGIPDSAKMMSVIEGRQLGRPGLSQD
jgi:hypothetical protein